MLIQLRTKTIFLPLRFWTVLIGASNFVGTWSLAIGGETHLIYYAMYSLVFVQFGTSFNTVTFWWRIRTLQPTGGVPNSNIKYSSLAQPIVNHNCWSFGQTNIFFLLSLSSFFFCFLFLFFFLSPKTRREHFQLISNQLFTSKFFRAKGGLA